MQGGEEDAVEAAQGVQRSRRDAVARGPRLCHLDAVDNARERCQHLVAGGAQLAVSLHLPGRAPA